MIERRTPAPAPRRHRAAGSSQAGLGTIAMVAILVVIGIIFISIFLFANSGSNGGNQNQNTGTNTGENTQGTGVTGNSDEPPFIRVPENSLTYKSSTYDFSFAYPNGFGKLTETTESGSGTGIVLRVESALANKKPVGNAGAVLSGVFGAYVYKKDDFKVLIADPEVYVAPTKTGNDTTWKIVSAGATTQDISVGKAYQAKVTKSQTGIPVFDFTMVKGTALHARYIFEAGNYYVVIILPSVSMPSGAAPTAGDLAAYKIIGANLATTVRSQINDDTATSTSGTSDDNTSTGN